MPDARLGVCAWACWLGMCLLAAPNNAWAALGGAVTAGAATPAAVQLRSAAASAPSNALYTVHTSTLDTGTTVQEYTTPGGVVFAVAWQGPVLPRLESLLGSYFGPFTAGAHAIRSQRSIGTPLVVGGAQWVVRSSGRMGHFSGHAYAPPLVPGGVTIGDVFP